MRIKRTPRTSGIFFAIWPRRTVEGDLVAFEWLHWGYVEGWGWGSDGHYVYRRWVPETEYDQGKRANTPRANHCEPFDDMTYATPPHCDRCRNLVSDGPTPCWYPHCDCMVSGVFPCGCELNRLHELLTRENTPQ